MPCKKKQTITIFEKMLLSLAIDPGPSIIRNLRSPKAVIVTPELNFAFEVFLMGAVIISLANDAR